MKTHFLSLNADAYVALMQSWGFPAFRGRQIAEWIYQKKVATLAGMSSLPRSLRSRLEEELDFFLPEIVDQVCGDDGSTKMVLRTKEQHLIECVIMRYKERSSLCVSTQVGCKLGCLFCQTGRLGFVANLAAHDILAQYMLANQHLEGENRRISHVVFMGMGEPLDNYAATVMAANRLMAPDGFALSARHVTISTAGIPEAITRLATDSRAALAVSLHAASDALRSELMPINRRHPLESLKRALTDYQAQTSRKIMIEYIMIKDKNCAIRDAKDLVRFLQGIRAKVNLIPFNHHPGLPFERPDDEVIRAFQLHLTQRSIPAPVRYSLGGDLSGACGQLAARLNGNTQGAVDREGFRSHLK